MKTDKKLRDIKTIAFAVLASIAWHSPGVLAADVDGDGIRDTLDRELYSFSNICSNADAVLANQHVLNGQILQCAASNSVLVQSTVIIETGGRLEVISPFVRFAPDFSVPPGGG